MINLVVMAILFFKVDDQDLYESRSLIEYGLIVEIFTLLYCYLLTKHFMGN